MCGGTGVRSHRKGQIRPEYLLPAMRLPMEKVENVQLKIKEACWKLSARLGCQHNS